MCSQLTIKTPDQRHWRRSSVSIVNFEQVNVSWDENNLAADMNKGFVSYFRIVSCVLSVLSAKL